MYPQSSMTNYFPVDPTISPFNQKLFFTFFSIFLTPHYNDSRTSDTEEYKTLFPRQIVVRLPIFLLINERTVVFDCDAGL